MLHRLHIERFKSFGSRQSFPLAKITLLFGQNSAGKSSFIQSLLLLKQTFEAQDTATGSRHDEVLVLRGPLADLASFSSIAHDHDTDRPVTIGIDFGRTGEAASRGIEFSFEQVAGAIRLGEVQTRFDAQQMLRFRSVTGVPGWGPLLVLASESAPTWVDLIRSVEDGSGATQLHPGEPQPGLTDLVAEGVLLPLFENRSSLPGEIVGVTGVSGMGARFEDPAAPRRLFGSSRAGTAELRAIHDLRTRHPAAPDPALAEWQAAQRAFRNEYASQLAAISYLGPLREPPQRLTVLSSTSRRALGPKGENSAQVLFDDPQLLGNVNVQLGSLGVPYQLTVVPLRGGDGLEQTVGDVVAIQLRDTRTGVLVSPSDVGFGISQLLPVVIQSQAERRILLIEQPEIHLHPKLQAEMADLFVRAATAGLNNQFIIETHSEALMLRLQRRIRKGALKPEDVSVIYIDQAGGEGAYFEPLRLDIDGEFMDDWPGGFFDERLDEIFS